MTVSVTQEHIDRGERRSDTGCPVGLALREATGRSWSVSAMRLMDAERGKIYPASLSVALFVARFDAAREARPFEFRLPGEALK